MVYLLRHCRFAAKIGGTFSHSWGTWRVMGASSEIAMPLDSTAECAEERRGLKTVSKLCDLRVLRDGKSLDFQTVSLTHCWRISA